MTNKLPCGCTEEEHKELFTKEECHMLETMSFEEQFPSLKDYCVDELNPYGLYGEVDDVKFQELLMKHCLDKQRVKEALEMYLTEKHCGTVWANTWRKELLEVWGLDK